MEKLIIGSRGSKLALKYAEIAKKAFLKELDIETVSYTHLTLPTSTLV